VVLVHARLFAHIFLAQAITLRFHSSQANSAQMKTSTFNHSWHCLHEQIHEQIVSKLAQINLNTPASSPRYLVQKVRTPSVSSKQNRVSGPLHPPMMTFCRHETCLKLESPYSQIYNEGSVGNWWLPGSMRF